MGQKIIIDMSIDYSVALNLTKKMRSKIGRAKPVTVVLSAIAHWLASWWTLRSIDSDVPSALILAIPLS